MVCSLVPRPPPFCVLRFVFSIIHGSGRARKMGKAWFHSSRENDVRGGINRKNVYIALSKNRLSGSPNAHETWPVQKIQSKNTVWSSDWQVQSSLTRLQVYAYSKLLGWSPPHYIIFVSTSRPPDVTHVMNETRPSPFFALFRFRVLYWTQTEEHKTGEAWERGYTICTCSVPPGFLGILEILEISVKSILLH